MRELNKKAAVILGGSRGWWHKDNHILAAFNITKIIRFVNQGEA